MDKELKNIDIRKLNDLSSEEKKLALEILQQLADSGESELFDKLKYNDFDEVPVTIDEFMDNEIYLGRGLWSVDAFTGERYCTVFPYWRNVLRKLFPDNLTTAYNTLILTGAIGIGKTFVGVIAILYLLYRILCLKDPYEYFGMQKIDKITFSMLNITLDAAQGVAWDKAQQMIQSSEWFMSHGSINASRSNPQWQPPKGIELIFGSNNRHIVGRALFANLTDEVNFGIGNNVEKQKAKQKKMIAQIDARMRSRFLRGSYLPTLNVIISSKDTEQAFLQSYIENKRKNESKTSLIVDEPQWVVDPRKGTPDDEGAFYVAIGNKFLAHELLPKNADEELVEKYRAKGYTMQKVPPGYRETFEDNLDQALMDIIGYSVSNSVKYISGPRLAQAKTNTYQNPFLKDVFECGNDPEDHTQYYNFFDLSKVSTTDLARPLFIHLDMSISGDKTGIAGVWITGKTPTIEGDDNSRSLRFKLAFSASIKAPKGFQVSFEKTRIFIKWLREAGFSIKNISADTFQSANILQELQSDGFKTSILSVDRVDKVETAGPGSGVSRICLPYHYLKTAIYERHVEIYDKCNQLTDELIGLDKKSDGHIDHTALDGSINSKDQADAFCGAVYTASKFADEYSYNYGENLDASIDVSSDLTDNEKKAKMIEDFQSDLMAIYKEIDADSLETINNNIINKNTYEYYTDLADGIIVI